MCFAVSSPITSKQEYRAGRPPKGVVKLDVSFCPKPESGEGSTVGNPDNIFKIFSAGHHYEFTCKCDTEKEMVEWVDIVRNLTELQN